MKRSAIMAQRERNNQAQAAQQARVAAAATGGGGSSSGVGSLPPFVHKSSVPSSIPSSLAALAAAPSPLPPPRWTLDISLKERRRQEENAKRREETQKKKQRKEATAEGGAGGQHASQHAAAAATDDDLDIDLDDAPPSPSHMSAAKRAFMSQMKDKQAAESAASASAAASSAATAASSSGATALPAFSPAKPARLASSAPSPLRGSGIAPIKKPPGAAATAAAAQAAEKAERYYSIGFCAKSTKKHKNYDDGVLVVCGRRCTVKNMSSQTVSTQLVPFSTDKLEEGGLYHIATSEVELGAPIPEEEYMSGRIFVGSTAATPAPSSAASSARAKTAITPFARIKASNARGGGAEGAAAAAAAMEATLADPNIMLLNRNGIIERGEKAVIVDLFLAKQLRTHQREGVQFMYDCVMGVSSRGYEGCILADEMGLGKTLQSIALLFTLLGASPTKAKGGECSKAIVVCPATLLNNWNREFTKWLGSHRCKPVVLTASLNANDQASMVQDFISGAGKDYTVMIVSYELFRKHATALSVLDHPLLICDEGHRLKSTSSNKTISALAKLKTKKRIMLTGTPVQNDLGEFFAMCDFVNPNIMGSLSTFRRTFETPISRSRDTSADRKTKELGEARAQELTERTKSFVLRRSSALLLQYLPEKVEQVLFLPLMPMQAEIYRAMLRGKQVRAVLARGSGGPNDALSLQCINSLKKLANHPALVYDECRSQSTAGEVKSAFSLFPDNYVPVSNFSDPTQSSKLAVLDHLLTAIRAEGKKVVVVSNYIQTLDMLEKYLATKGWQWLRLDGTTSAADRPVMVDRFNATYASDHFVFLLSAKAGGVGLNLIGGNRLILFDPDWNPAIDLQAMSRVWRDGQKSTVYIYRFLSTATIDEKIYQRQLRKNELSFSVMQKGGGSSNGGLRNFDAKSLKDIFSYRDVTRCETRDVLRKDRTAEEQEELEMSLGEFHTDLSKAMDPILQRVPSHLVSTFLNRVSSLEENQRVFEQMAARAQKKHEKDLERAEGGDCKDKPAEVNEEDEFDEEEEDEESTQAVSKASAGSTNSSRHVSEDEDEGEAEFGQPAPAAAAAAASSSKPPPPPAAAATAAASSSFTSPFTAPPRSHAALLQTSHPPPRASRSRLVPPPSSSMSWPTAEEMEAEEEAQLGVASTPGLGLSLPTHAEAAAGGEDEDDEEAEYVPPIQTSGSKKRSRRIFDDEEEEEVEAAEAAAAAPVEEPAEAPEAAADNEDNDDMSGAPPAAAAPASTHSLLLDTAAASIAPPPSPDWMALDTISTRAEPPESTPKRGGRR